MQIENAKAGRSALSIFNTIVQAFYYAFPDAIYVFVSTYGLVAPTVICLDIFHYSG